MPDIFPGPHTYQKVESTPATFKTCTPDQTPVGYGGNVIFECREGVLPPYLRKALDAFSIWGVNTSNVPEEYSLWELNDDYREAIRFLEQAGFRKIVMNHRKRENT